MSTPNPLQQIELAAIPTGIAILQALKAFDAVMGPDPTQWVLKYPGARLVLAGTVANQLLPLLQSEGGVVVGALDAEYGNLITKLQAKQAAAKP